MRITKDKELINNLIKMLGFGLLAFLMDKIRFYLSGVQTSISDLGEIPILISILYFSNWIYFVGISLIAFIGEIEVLNTYLFVSTLHFVAAAIIWISYNKFKNKYSNTIEAGFLWSLMVLVYYMAIMLPIDLLSWKYIALIENYRRKYSMRQIIESETFELFISLAFTTFYFIINHLTNDLKLKNMELGLTSIKAKESDRLKSAFLANMSHEIRTPMNGIIGFSSLLAEEDLCPSTRKEYTDHIINSGNHLLAILNDILDISKIEVGQMDLNLSKVDINLLFDNIYAFYISKAKTKQIQFEILKQFRDNQCIITTDKDKLQQVIDNLLNNAFKFTDTGEICIGYEIIGKNIKIYVKDTGIGIDTFHKKMIFERFVQVETGYSRTFGGTGLGLSISKALVEIMGGKIYVESTLGQGSIFYFTIPMVNNSEIDQNIQSIPEHLNFDKNCLEGFTILVAEDDIYSYLFIAEIIIGYKGKVLHVKNGMEAVELCKVCKGIDLVIIDISMPQMDGIEATRKIRSFNKELPIIAQTAFVFGNDKELAISAGCNDYLIKPFSKNKLLLSILKNFQYNHNQSVS